MKPRSRRLRFFVVALSSLLVLAASTLAILYRIVTADLPNIGTLRDYQPRLVTHVFDDDGELIGEFFLEKRELVALADVPEVLRLAVIAAEDAKFYYHEGLDFMGIMRALLKNVRAGEIVQGGSTITQQVVKSLLLTPEKSYKRKLREAILAYRLEKSLSKDEILYLYLNQIYFGNGAYGVRTASKCYFGHDVTAVDLAEASLLAGLPRAPTRYSPVRNLELARERQRYVLERMVEEGFVTRQQMEAAIREPLQLVPGGDLNLAVAPYFLDEVRSYLLHRYGKDRTFGGGLQVHTTIRKQEQRIAQEALAAAVASYEKRHPRSGQTEAVAAEEGGAGAASGVEGALVSMELPGGQVRAMIGGMDYTRSQFNRAVHARRQPGSAFKGLLYAAALDKGYTPASIVVDSPIVFHDPVLEEKWKPRNYSRYFVGPTTLRDALAHSRNVVTIKVLQDIGVSYAIRYVQRMGIRSALTPDLSLALGTSEVSLFELVDAYAVYPSQGERPEPILVREVLDAAGNRLEETEPRSEPVLTPVTAYLMTSLLQSVVGEGTGRAVQALGVPCAGKTGTTNDFRDAWFIGYIPDRITGVWLGYDQPRSLGNKETGGRLAAPVWLQFMKGVTQGSRAREFPVPLGIVFANVDVQTGLLAGLQSSRVRFECFREGTEPREVSEEAGQSDEIDFFREELDPGGSPPLPDLSDPID
ncbi:MAG: PBP1A family penicillin-binding protein [bacterium]